MPILDRGQHTHGNYLVAEFAEMVVAFVELLLSSGVPFTSFTVTPSLSTRSLHGHHYMIEFAVVDICAHRPTERLFHPLLPQSSQLKDRPGLNEERPRRSMIFFPPWITLCFISSHSWRGKASVPIIWLRGWPATVLWMQTQPSVHHVRHRFGC